MLRVMTIPTLIGDKPINDSLKERMLRVRE
jgi:hypothetical protein